ncbi:MAG: coenzyme F420-0:L-glutamate ligase [Defluviitaleaceae bacterium]|nr:coenzyme F420-0:L-glutamate ligase [Defluviitaleaceae bacterium]
MGIFGTVVRGVKAPIIRRGSDLVQIVADSMAQAAEQSGESIEQGDIVAITESVVSKAENNFAELDVIAEDVRAKLGGGAVGVLFPILSRNRFVNILKAVCAGAEKVYVQLSYPFDEVGNPLMDDECSDEVLDRLREMSGGAAIPIGEFRKVAGEYRHRFTGLDYAAEYAAVCGNVEVVVSNDPRHMLRLTKNILVAQVHERFRTRRRLLKADSTANVRTLCEIMDKPLRGSGYNPQFGLLGSNLSTDSELKLFPRDSETFVRKLQERFVQQLGHSPEILVYGDGAFKDPVCGIWELADPVVSPYYTSGLDGSPNEIKLKYLAETLDDADIEAKVREAISQKGRTNNFTQGTTPRRFHDLVGSLCDLTSGSGDKGTPLVWIKGYWNDYTCI